MSFVWYTNYRIDYNNQNPRVVSKTNCFSAISSELLNNSKEFSVFVPITNEESKKIENHSCGRLTNKKEALKQIKLLIKAGFPFKYEESTINEYPAYRVYFDITDDIRTKVKILLYATYIRYIYELAHSSTSESLIEEENYYAIFNIYSKLIKGLPKVDKSLLFHIAEQCMNQNKINNNHSGCGISSQAYNFYPVSIKERMVDINSVQLSFEKKGKINNFTKEELKELFDNNKFAEIAKYFNI